MAQSADSSTPSSVRCPVCGRGDTRHFADARDLEYFTTDETYRYRSCSSCRTVCLNDPPVDRLREIYPASYYSYVESGGSKSPVQRFKELLDARMFKRLLRQIPGEDLCVLDVGGGSGWLLDVLRRLSPRVTQTHEVDVDERAGEAAHARGHIFHCMRIEDFKSERQFDLILMLNLIEHVADPGAVLRAMVEALAPNGLILIKTPNTDSLDRRLFQNHNWGGFHCPRHWVLFTKAGFIDLAARCGLDCVSAKYTQAGWQWAASILAWMYRRKWIDASANKPLHTHRLFLPMSGVMAGFDFLRLPFAPTTQMLLTLKRAA